MENMSLKQRVALYRNFDEARQKELEQLANQVEVMNEQLLVLKADIEDEQVSRRNWRRRAEEAENAINRNQFVLVLIDGDGYYFREAFLNDASDNGGARAAYQLYTEVQQYLQVNGLATPDIQIMVNVYANKSGLARFLCDADILQIPNQLDQFFCSFSQSQSLFQFIDCGFGKERADAKFRDTYRFYAYNAQCKHIFLACCHDAGYVAELDKYRHDPVASSKTILVHAAQTAKPYSTLPFSFTRFNSVFEEYVPQIAIKPQNNWKEPSPVPTESQAADDAASQTSNEAVVSPALPTTQTWAATASSHQKPSTRIQVRPLSSPRDEESEPKAIAVNKYDQRIDRPLRQPTATETAAFETRIARKKLCNKHHLNRSCFSGKNCTFDHEPISPSMLNALKIKARSIPCAQGQGCRRADCFYGHQCPWVRTGCNNSKCAFRAAKMHNISDTEVARMVPAEV